MLLKKRFLVLLAVFCFLAYAVYRLEPYVRIQMDDH